MSTNISTLTILRARNVRVPRKTARQSSVPGRHSFRILLVSLVMALEVIFLGAPALAEDTIILASVRTVWFKIKPFLLRTLLRR
jgi:hypothetical protein